MQVVEQALRDEAQRIDEYDAERDRTMLDHARQRLQDAYRLDLETTETLNPQWVESATTVYVAGREALLRQELELATRRQTRRDNLNTAADAQARAIAILQQQDRLLQQTVGLDLWRLDPIPRNPSP